MARARNKRGSVLLMAIGLLTIIALLASMFLIVANLDATEAAIMSSKDQANMLAQNILSSVVARIGEDRYCGSTTDYSYPGPPAYKATQAKPFGQLASNTSSSTWKCFIDHPGVDTWLSSCYDPTEPNGFAFLSRIADTGIDKVDTDLDGIPDAYKTATANTSGSYYWAAVHVSDLAGRVCLNTAGLDPCATPAPTGMTTVITPTYINLKGLLGDANYTNIHTARCNNTTQTLLDYYNNCGSILLAPASSTYTPFSIADELFLLWRAPATQAPMTNQGRVYQATPSLTASLKQLHTTFSCTGAQVRRPACDCMQGINPLMTTDPSDSLIQLDTSTDAARQKIYQRVLRMIHQLRIGVNASDPIADLPKFMINDSRITANQKKMAAHFVANLWANQRPGDAPWRFKPRTIGNSFPYPPTDEAFTAYGLRQDLVISEAFAKHKKDEKKDTPDANSNHYWGYAVELLNPTPDPIAVSSATYSLKMNGTEILTTAFTVPGAAGGLPGRKVLYNCDYGPKYTSGAKGVFGADPNDPDGTPPNLWVKVTGLDFSGGTVSAPRKFQMYRKSPPDTNLVPLDEVGTGAAELNYSYPKPANAVLPDADANVPVVADVRRDDRMTNGGTEVRARYNIAAYVRSTSPSPVYLNKPKLLSDSDLTTDANNLATYSVPIRPLAAIRSTADAANLYFAGPMDSNAFPQRIRGTSGWGTSTGIATAMFSNIPGRGRLALAPMKITGSALDANNCHDGFTPGLYPDVPAATLWNEFVTNLRPHDTRPNEKSRIYGQININTASREVLRQLPWPKTITRNTTPYTIDKELAISYLLAYRDMKQVSGGPNYATRATVMVGGGTRTITGLRADAASNIAGFLTPGEAAIPLGDYMISLMGASTALCADYTRARNALYAAIADCITVRSDVFSVHIRVNVDNSPYIWYYTGVIDRSNCTKREHMPAVLLFAEVR